MKSPKSEPRNPPITAQMGGPASVTDTTAIVAQAAKLAQLGQVEDALALLDNETNRLGEQPALLREKAELHFLKDDYVGAGSAFDRLATISPKSPDGWLGKGWSLLQQGNAEQALEYAKRALALDEKSADGHELCGDSLLQLGRWNEAFSAFQAAAEFDPRHFDAASWGTRGDRFLESDQLDLALEAYSRAIEQDPQSSAGWYGKGIVLSKRGESDAALAALERASKYHEWFIAGLLQAGELCVELGWMDRALGYFEEASRRQPDDPRPWTAAGDTHQSLGRHEKARAAYEHAVEIDAHDIDTWNALGNSLFHLSQLEDAERCYKRAIEIDPDFPWPYYNLAWVMGRRRQLKEAIATMEQAIDRGPTNGDFLVGKLTLLNQMNNVDPAVIASAAEQASRKIGARTDLTVRIAGVLADNGLFDQARAIVTKLDYDSIKDEDERLELAECLLNLGDLLGAQRQLRALAPESLSGSNRVVWSYLYLIADRMGEKALSEQLLEGCLINLMKSTDREQTDVDWNYRGIRSLLKRVNFSVTDKLVCSLLIDLQEGEIERQRLSFFDGIWNPPQ